MQWGNTKGKADVLILLEFAEQQKRIEALEAFFSLYFQSVTWKMIPALGCTPKGFDLKTDTAANFSECKRLNVKKVVKQTSPKVVLTVGRALYHITDNADLQHDNFYSLHEDDTWLYSPEYGCKVLPLPPAYLWVTWDVYEQHFVKEQIKRAHRFIRERKPRIPKLSFELVRNPDELLDDINNDSSIEWVGTDTETGGFNYFSDELFSVQLSWTGYSSVIFYFRDLKNRGKLIEFFDRKKIAMQNATFDMKFFWNNGIPNAHCDFDTMLASHALNENSPNGLKPQTWIHTYYGGYEQALQRYMKLKRIEDYRLLPEPLFIDYAGTDPCVTLQLKWYLERRLKEEDERVKNNFYNIVMPAVPMIAEMEQNGIPVDVQYMHEYNTMLERRKRRIEQIIHRETDGMEFNTKSRPQLSKIVMADPNFEMLMDDRGNPMIGKDGCLKLNKETLPMYAEQGITIARYLADYNSVNKSISMLGLSKMKDREDGVSSLFDEDEGKEQEAEDGFIASITMVDERYGRLHTNFKLPGTDTGRLASSGGLTKKSKINGQNFTKKRAFRKIFGCPEDWFLMQLDYKMSEMRIASQASGPGVLEDLILDGKDLHCYTLMKSLGLRGHNKTYDEIVHLVKKIKDAEYKAMREQTKRVNFGAIYNATAHTLSRELKISIEDAQGFLDAFFESYPEYKQYMHDMVAMAKEKGYVMSLMGRKRRLLQLSYHGKDSDEKKYRTRIDYGGLVNRAINFPVQSVSGQVCIKSLTEIYKDWKEKKMKSQLVLTVHDSIAAVVHRSELEYAYDSMRHFMCKKYYENVGRNKVLHDVDCEIGPFSFGEAIESKEDIKIIQEKGLDYLIALRNQGSK
jgi:DNA polymerase-1